MQGKTKRLRIIAGPNGSGKSSVVFHILSNYYCGHFVNADELNKQFLQSGTIDLLTRFDINTNKDSFDSYLNLEGSSWIEKAKKEGKEIAIALKDNALIIDSSVGDYDAAVAADFIRYQLLKRNETFTFETVLSDTRKVAFLKRAADEGFKLYLYFVCTAHPVINKLRVATRVAKGGHFVADDKIESRYYNSLQILPELIPLTTRCYLFDNSVEGIEKKLNLVADIEEGALLRIHSTEIPNWVEEYVLDKLF